MVDPTGQQYDAFVSHSSADAEAALELVGILEAAGLSCWIAPRDIRTGEEYGAEIIRGLRRSRSLIVLLSEQSRESRHVRNEVERATNLDHPIYCVRLADVEPGERLELFLSMGQRLDAFKGDRQGHWAHLATVLKDAVAPGPYTSRADNFDSTSDVPPTIDPPLPPSIAIPLKLLRIVLYTVIGWALLELDPLGFSGAMDRASERVLYSVAAPYYGSEFLGGPPPPATTWNRQVSVLLFDDSALKMHKLAWPVSLDVHTRILADLYDNYQPAAIMIDILFTDRRGGQENNLQNLRQLLLRIKQEGRTKVYLAADSARSEDSNILEELRDTSELVAVTWRQPDAARDAPLFYPLANPIDADGNWHGPGPAYAIYRDLCAEMDTWNGGAMRCPNGAPTGDDFQLPMQVFWGVDAPPLNWEQANLGERFNCHSVKGTVLARSWSFMRTGLTGKADEFLQGCPYAQMILARDFLDTDFRKEDDVKAAYAQALGPIQGTPKVVFYGASLRGMADTLHNYTHGETAGVFLHAMALNNLLTMGKDYIRYGKNDWKKHLMTVVLALLVALTSVWMTDLRLNTLRTQGRLSWPRQQIRRLAASGVGSIALVALNLALLVPILALAVYVAFIQMRLAPINWVGFFGIAGLFGLIETRKIERAALSVVTRFSSRDS